MQGLNISLIHGIIVQGNCLKQSSSLEKYLRLYTTHSTLLVEVGRITTRCDSLNDLKACLK